jgi:hypothetical protein
MAEAFSFEVATSLWEKAVSQLKAVRNSDPRQQKPFLRAAFEASALVLDAYIHPANWIGGVAKDNLPRDLAGAISHQIHTILTGKVPEPIQDFVTAHRPCLAPQERTDIHAAVLYVKGARAGKVKDAAPIKTVMEEFGVLKRTVQQWNSKYRGLDLDEALRYLAPGETPSQYLTERMKEAGKRYRYAGRSSTAHRSRNSKRQPGG